MVKKKLGPLPTWTAFAFELLIYAALVVAYFFLVLHYLSGWFKELFDHDRRLFAVMCLVVMIGQTAVLEGVSSTLVWLLRREKK
jgi:Kef-type K+ transport system membrane component KefB